MLGKVEAVSDYVQTKLLAKLLCPEATMRFPADQNLVPCIKPGLIIGNDESAWPTSTISYGV